MTCRLLRCIISSSSSRAFLPYPRLSLSLPTRMMFTAKATTTGSKKFAMLDDLSTAAAYAGKAKISASSSSILLKEREEDSGKFSPLHGDLVAYIYQFMDTYTAGRLTCTCRRFSLLMKDLFKERCRERFRIDVRFHEVRLKHEPEPENTWRNFYQRLDNVKTGWRGFAFDPITNLFQPYEMEMVIQETSIRKVKGIVAEALARECTSIPGLTEIRLEEFQGFCRWRSVNDAMTKLNGSIVDVASRFDRDPITGRDLVRHIIFEETHIIRGENIAIPNRYFGFLDGSIILGLFDPSNGQQNLKGAFCLIMEETISIPRQIIQFRPHEVWTGLASSTDNRYVHYCQMIVSSNLEGVLTGSFAVDQNIGVSSCKSKKRKPDWFIANFTGTICSDPLQDVILKDIHFNQTLRHPLVPSSSISLHQHGPFLLGFFRNPFPTCFYLMPAISR